MTRTLAAKVIEGLRDQGWEIIGYGGTWAGAMRPLASYIQRKVERAVEAEREACARVVEDVEPSPNPIINMANRLAASAIRARGEKK